VGKVKGGDGLGGITIRSVGVGRKQGGMAGPNATTKMQPTKGTRVFPFHKAHGGKNREKSGWGRSGNLYMNLKQRDAMK